MVEIIISALAILLIVALGRFGAQFGVFYELTSTLCLFFAMMLTLRYWYELTGWICAWWPGQTNYAAFGAYWALFLIGCMPLLYLMRRVTEDSVPKYPRSVDVVLGIAFGALSAIILVCSVMTSVSVIAPKIWEPYNRNALWLPFDQIPLTIYRFVEADWFHITDDNPGHTRLPSLNKYDADNFENYWR
jgi:uncharacterized membrane protein required for colicin V production